MRKNISNSKKAMLLIACLFLFSLQKGSAQWAYSAFGSNGEVYTMYNVVVGASAISSPYNLLVNGDISHKSAHGYHLYDPMGIYANTSTTDGPSMVLHGILESYTPGDVEFTDYYDVNNPSTYSFEFKCLDPLNPAPDAMTITHDGDVAVPFDFLVAGTSTFNNIDRVDQYATIQGDAYVYSFAQVDNISAVFGGHNLYITGNMYASNYFYITSDRRFKKLIAPLTSVKNDLFKIEPVQYSFDKNAFPKKNFDDQLHFGFIAQDVQKVYPNLVSQSDSAGHLAINYPEFIPLLLARVKEEDQQIQQLRTKLTDLQSKLTAIDARNLAINNIQHIAEKSTLSQNVPNPANGDTRIDYSIAKNTTYAYIGIYDLTGREIRNITIQPNSSQVIIPAGTMAVGMYVYSLVVDNVLIDTKRMIIQ